MNKKHNYQTALQWRGNTGEGTSSYRAYKRDYIITIDGKPHIEGSSDPSFRGDPNKHNPEELFVASLSACHMLWYLHLCADAGIIVLEYSDQAQGIMEEYSDGGGAFTEVMLHPAVTIRDPQHKEDALRLHEKANKKCFIANSCNFPVRHNPVVKVSFAHS